MLNFQPMPTRVGAQRAGCAFPPVAVRGVMAITLMASLAACSSVTPLPQDPAAELQLETLQNENLNTTERLLHAPSDWWSSFDDAELERLIGLGLQNNYSLKAALANWQSSQAALQVARADQSLTADASISRSQQWQQSDNSGNWSLGVAADYELDFWGRLDGLTRQSQLSADASFAAARTVANSVAAEISLAWFGIRYQQQMLGLIAQQRQRVESSLKIINARFQRGLVDVSDIWQQEQLLESLHSDQLTAEAELQLYQQQLALWTATAGRQSLASGPDQPGDNAPKVHESEPKTGEIAGFPALSDIGQQVSLDQLQQRPDVLQSWFELQASDAALAAAVANRYPRLTLSAGLEGNGGSIAAALDNWAFNLAAGLVAPLIDGGSRKAQVEQQLSSREAALASYRQTLLTAAQEIQGLLVDQQRMQKQYESLQRQLDLARRTHEYQQARYRRGVGDFLATLSANQDVLSLEQQQLTLRWQQFNNRINLYRAVSHGRFDTGAASPSSLTISTTSAGPAGSTAS